VKDPQEVVKVRQPVYVTVLAIDRERKRISLSLKKQPEADGRSALPELLPNGATKTTAKPRGKPVPAKPGDRKAPFNNPFAQAFGKK